MRPFLLALLAAPLLTSPLLAQANSTTAAVKKPFWVDSTNWDAITTSYLTYPDGQEGPVLNKPFSAIEVRHSPHLTSNRSHPDYLDTNEIYRDARGRTRVQGSKIIVLFDPVIDKTYALRREEKDYKESLASHGIREKSDRTRIAVFGDGGYIGVTGNYPGPAPEGFPEMWGWFQGVFTPTNHVDTVDLGTLTISGLVCKGTRVTLTIPALDRKNDIHIIRERWYSDDLQALVESIDDDPRFGMSTYELKEIKRGEPDPSLFKLPEGYTPTTTLDWVERR
jgi:hypothetical protein